MEITGESDYHSSDLGRREMRWVAVLFILVCIMVPIGFYIQAHGNFRGRARLEPWAQQLYKEGATVKFRHPLPVCDTELLCAESRRMSLRLREAEKKGKSKDIQVAHDWYKMLEDNIKFCDQVLVLQPNQNYTKVRITAGDHAGFEGFIFTVALEEEAQTPEGQAAPARPKSKEPAISY
jgi:hypothetical protein